MSLRGIMHTIGITTALVVSSFAEEKRPFPVGTTFEKCIKPNHVTQAVLDSTVSDLYFSIKEKYIAKAKSQNGGYYVLSGGGTGGSEGLITISEAHGYGMITTALMAGTGPLADPEARTIFDGMLQFFLDHPSEKTNALMSWEVLTDGNGGESTKQTGNATDGDMDVAYALLLAHYQWGSTGKFNYLAEAKRIINDGLKVWNMNAETMRTNLGDWVNYSYYDEWSGQEVTGIIDQYYWGSRPSDWMTGHMHAYAEATGDQFWTEAADTVYALINKFTKTYSPKTGLISDFIDGKNGGPAAENYLDEFKETNHYYENACRVPLRLTVDYAHFGTATAYNTVNGIVKFIRSATNENPENISFGYNIQTGAALYPTKKSTRFSAPLITGAIVSAEHQTYLNNGWDLMAKTRESYYSDYLNLLSMLVISGNWWPPVKDFVIDIADRDMVSRTVQFSGISHSVTNSVLNLSFNLTGISSDLSVTLFSVTGREIVSGVAKSSGNGQFTATIPANLANAVYCVRIGNETISHTAKILIQ